MPKVEEPETSSKPEEQAAVAAAETQEAGGADGGQKDDGGLGPRPRAPSSPKDAEAAPGDKPAPDGGGGSALEDAVTLKIQSAVRWGKPEEEIQKVVQAGGATMLDAVGAQDPKTGNRCLHVASQNGHLSLCKFLLAEKADVNAQNGKGQTALHMSVEYDFYFVSVVLQDAGADASLTNGDGNKAITGIDGGKVEKEAWDHPLNILKGAGDNAEEIETAMKALEAADPASLDKAALAQAGMAKRRSCKQNWNGARFMDLMKKL